jgi:thiamine pyrophosphate-dependent acetolactate synthase large subunit-like protein
MTQVGAKTLFNRLLHHNFKYVFGYPGGAILPVLNEFYAQKKIKILKFKSTLTIKNLYLTHF